MLDSEAACRHYLKNHTAADIARQLRHDQELCKLQKLPSVLVLYVPKVDSALGTEIAAELSNQSFPRSIQALQYNGIIQGIRAYLHHMTPAPKHGPLPFIGSTGELQPSRSDYEGALKVLEYYMKSGGTLESHNPVEHVISLIKKDLKQLAFEDDRDDIPISNLDERSSNNDRQIRQQRKCYICRFRLSNRHRQYPSLCKPCGDFNLASCNLSAPSSLCLKGRNALVTGGRVNLGYHTALQLLRCGAQVMITTRYPRDAETRYFAEKDFNQWSASLQIIGADFRAANDVFEMITRAKECLEKWCAGEYKLDILINNAAQTLTDPLNVEVTAVQREGRLRVDRSHDSALLLDRNYEARVRGGVKPSLQLGLSNETLRTPSETNGSIEENYEGGQNVSFGIAHHGDSDAASTAVSIISIESSKSSWMQSINQIPYEDVISAHSVNTFVPLILIRELLPLMGSSRIINTASQPLAYIINVSSREGIFEAHPSHSSKNGHHVHTNLTKAALNMLTETEAGPAWENRGVAMNTVDPGYMSAAPEIARQQEEIGRVGCPISWEDGVGRVLWPVATGENGEPVWGRFLKHFGKVAVEVGVGR